MEAKPLQIRLTVEGIEIPVVSAICTGGINTAGSATAQIVPTDEVMDLLPRSLVHIFYFDSDADPHKYRLLFTGELVAVDYVQSHTQRVAVLKCLDFSSYWDTARLNFFGKTDDGLTTTQTQGSVGSQTQIASFTGAASYYGQAKTSRSPADVLLRMLTGKSVGHPDVEGLMGGLLLLLETMGGVYVGKKTFRGLNDFFSQAELRLHMSRMLGSARKDDSAVKLLGSYGFKKMLQKAITARSNTLSFRDVMSMSLQRIQHNYASVLAPYFAKQELVEDVEVTVSSSSRIDNDAVKRRIKRLEGIRDATDEILSGKGESHVKLERAGVDPVRAHQDTHTKLGPSLEYDYSQDSPGGVSPEVDALKEDKDFAQAAYEEQKVIDKLASMTHKETAQSDPYPPGTAVLMGSNEQPYYPNIDNISAQHLKDATNSAIDAYKRRATKTSSKKIRVDVLQLPRLYTHVFNPEIFLCPPPRCNVLFPEHIVSLSMSRNYLAETTRLHLTSRKEWDGKGVQQSHKSTYIAPDIEALFGMDPSKKTKKGETYLFPHEKFTGIVPIIDQMMDAPAYQSIQKDLKKEKSDQNLITSTKVGYMQKMANFLFLKARLGVRSLNIQGRFNPTIATGMPTLILPKMPTATQEQALKSMGLEDCDELVRNMTNDPASTLGQLGKFADQLKTENLPMVYSGMIASVTHSISQQGGVTSYVVSHVWFPTKEEIPGITSPTIRRVVGHETVETVTQVMLNGVLMDPSITDTSVDIPSFEEGHSYPEGTPAGEKKHVANVSEQQFNDKLDTYRDDKGNPVGAAQYIASSQSSDGTWSKAKVKVTERGNKWIGPNGHEIESMEFLDVGIDPENPGCGPGALTGDYVTKDNRQVMELTSGTAKMRITEKKPIYVEETLDVPFEYIVRPPWMGPTFTNLRIGQDFYQNMFGCSSICDRLDNFSLDTYIGYVRQLATHPEWFSLYTAEEGPIPLLKGADDSMAPKVLRFVEDIMGGFTMKQSAMNVIKQYIQHKTTGDKSLLYEFVREFTGREVATFEDIFGPPYRQPIATKTTPDEGSAAAPVFTDGVNAIPVAEEGFHSRACGSYNPMVILDHPKLRMYDGEGEERRIPGDLDPRKERHEAILRYIGSLSEVGFTTTGSWSASPMEPTSRE